MRDRVRFTLRSDNLIHTCDKSCVGLDELHEKLDIQRRRFEEKLGESRSSLEKTAKESSQMKAAKEEEIENMKSNADDLERRLNAVQHERDEESTKCKDEIDSFNADKAVLVERVRGLEDEMKSTKSSANASAKIAGAKEALLSLGQALYSNAPASFERIDDDVDFRKAQTCPGSGGGRTPSSENDAEEKVTSLSVQRYEVFVNPGRPMDDSKEKQADLNATTTTTASSSSLKETGEGIDYSHMAMISKLPARALWKWIMVWQAAQVKEGEPDQHFMCAYSDDAKTWTKAIRMPIGKQRGAIPWAPVLRLSGETLTLFFAESSTCIKPGGGVAAIDGADIPRWAPGGDIRFATTRDGFRWSKRVELLTQSYNTGIPKVIANPAIQISQGDHKGTLILPYWEEVPRMSTKREGCPSPDATPSAGALISKDNGRTWKPSESSLTDSETWLIEGTMAELSNSSVLHLFRTSVGEIYKSLSDDGGRTWTKASSTGLPNPNSKIHLLRLADGRLALAYNHDRKYRANLYVAISEDDGGNWHLAAIVEKGSESSMYAYPTMVEDECKLYVAYSIMTRRDWKEIQERTAHEPNGGGIYVAEIDLVSGILRGEEAMLLNPAPENIEVVEEEMGLSNGSAMRSKL
ncbi:unnamed protein product [Bathycoccus prasinos]